MAEDKNADQGDAGLGLESEDRLPWLEAADGVEEDGEVSPARLLVMVLGGLLLIGAVLGGLWWVQNGGARGKGELIAAQDGNYKIAPKNDGAKTFEGEGDASFSASEGRPDADARRAGGNPAGTRSGDRQAGGRQGRGGKGKGQARTGHHGRQGTAGARSDRGQDARRGAQGGTGGSRVGHDPAWRVQQRCGGGKGVGKPVEALCLSGRPQQVGVASQSWRWHRLSLARCGGNRG